jgi:hypothetical protein
VPVKPTAFKTLRPVPIRPTEAQPPGSATQAFVTSVASWTSVHRTGIPREQETWVSPTLWSVCPAQSWTTVPHWGPGLLAVVVVAGALDVVVTSVVVTDAVVVMAAAVVVDVAVKDELVVDGLAGQVGSDTTILIC